MDPLMERLRDELVGTGLADPQTIRGCTPGEAADVAARQAVTLPERYREFLLVMGRGAGAFFRGSDVFYPRVVDLKEAAHALLQECGQPFALPDDALVFFMHQGYQFMYCRTAAGAPDPFVSYYLEGKPGPVHHHVTFTELLESEVRDQARLFALLSTSWKCVLRGEQQH